MLVKDLNRNYQTYTPATFRKTPSISFGCCRPHQNRRDEVSQQFAKETAEAQKRWAKDQENKRLKLLNLESKASKEVAALMLNFSNRIKNEAEYNPADVFQEKTEIQNAVAQSQVLSDPVTSLIVLNNIQKFAATNDQLKEDSLNQEFKSLKDSTKQILLTTVEQDMNRGKIPLTDRDKSDIKELCQIAQMTDGCNFGADFEKKLGSLVERQKEFERKKIQLELLIEHEMSFGNVLTPDQRGQVNSMLNSDEDKRREAAKLMLEYGREIFFSKNRLAEEEISERKSLLNEKQTVSVQAEPGSVIQVSHHQH